MRKAFLFLFATLIGTALILGNSHKGYPQESDRNLTIKWAPYTFYLPEKNQSFSITDPGETYNISENNRQSSSIALSGQATYPFTDRFRASGSLTHSMDKTTYNYGGLNILIPYNDAGLTNYINYFSNTAFRTGVEFDLQKDSTLYAGIYAGYRTGDYGVASSLLKTGNPEKVLSYELGVTKMLLDNRLQINTGGYANNYWDNQVLFPVQAFNGSRATLQQYIANTEEIKSYGAAVDVKASVTTKDQVDLKLTYQRSRHEKPTLSVKTSPATSLSEDTPTVIASTKKATSSELSGTVGYQHMFDLPNGGMLTVRGQSKISTGSLDAIEKNIQNAWQDGSLRSDAAISYAPSTDVQVNAWINNIENEDRDATVAPLSPMTIADPRTYGATLTVKW